MSVRLRLDLPQEVVRESQARELETRVTEMYRGIISNANLITDEKERIETLSNIARDFYQEGDLVGAVKDAKDFGMAIPDISRVLMRHGFVFMAFGVAGKSPDQQVKDDAFRGIAKTLAERGCVGESIRAMKMISDPAVKDESLEILILSARKAKGERALRQVFQYCMDDKNFDGAHRVATHIRIVGGKIDAFQDLGAAVKRIDDVKKREKILTGISQVLVLGGDPAGARDLAEEISHPIYKTRVLKYISKINKLA